VAGVVAFDDEAEPGGRPVALHHLAVDRGLGRGIRHLALLVEFSAPLLRRLDRLYTN
jgi:hypothetical protein